MLRTFCYYAGLPATAVDLTAVKESQTFNFRLLCLI